MRGIFLIFLSLTTIILNAQLRPRDRASGRLISCDELNCDRSDSTYEYADRICLNCFMDDADSTMLIEVNKVLQKFREMGKDVKSFNKQQTTWKSKCLAAAAKESQELQGYAESVVFTRTKLIWTNKRILYLKSYLTKL